MFTRVFLMKRGENSIRSNETRTIMQPIRDGLVSSHLSLMHPSVRKTSLGGTEADYKRGGEKTSFVYELRE